jgi:hypothetical protein
MTKPTPVLVYCYRSTGSAQEWPNSRPGTVDILRRARRHDGSFHAIPQYDRLGRTVTIRLYVGDGMVLVLAPPYTAMNPGEAREIDLPERKAWERK